MCSFHVASATGPRSGSGSVCVRISAGAEVELAQLPAHAARRGAVALPFVLEQVPGLHGRDRAGVEVAGGQARRRLVARDGLGAVRQQRPDGVDWMDDVAQEASLGATGVLSQLAVPQSEAFDVGLLAREPVGFAGLAPLQARLERREADIPAGGMARGLQARRPVVIAGHRMREVQATATALRHDLPAQHVVAPRVDEQPGRVDVQHRAARRVDVGVRKLEPDRRARAQFHLDRRREPVRQLGAVADRLEDLFRGMRELPFEAHHGLAADRFQSRP
jgi:hypothetical protein